MQRFNVLNTGELWNNEYVDIFLIGGYIQRYLSGTLFTQHTLQTPEPDTNKIGKFTCLTLWPVRNFAVPNARNSGDIFVINIRIEIRQIFGYINGNAKVCFVLCFSAV
jgi:hypothetical protein